MNMNSRWSARALGAVLSSGAAVVVAVALWPSTGSATGGVSTTADHLRTIETARLQALVDADTPTARKLIAPDFQLINPGGAVSSRQDYMDAVDAGIIDFLVFEPVSPIAVRLSGDSAALRYQVSFDLIVGGTRVTHQGWITELYERREGRWQIVWEQATAIPNDFGLFVESIKPVS
jgi:hypothetical protein